MSHTFKVPEEKISMGIIDIDADGKLGGTKVWCTNTFHFQITDSRESVIKRLIEGFDIQQRNLIKGNQ